MEFPMKVFTDFRALKQHSYSVVGTSAVSIISNSLCSSEGAFSRLFSFVLCQRVQTDFTSENVHFYNIQVIPS
jgi:hypothetical protein